MNWLAHVALSPPDTEHQLGNLLADFLRGRKWPGMSPALRDGLRLHQRIDAYTDAHPCWRQSRDRLGETGLLRGVVIDVVYDHMLTRHWENFAPQRLRPFLNQFYDDASNITPQLPSDAGGFVESLIHSDRLGRYGELDDVAEALERINRRLSDRIRRRDNMLRYLPLIEQAYDGIEADFLAFYPELIAHAANTDPWSNHST